MQSIASQQENQQPQGNFSYYWQHYKLSRDPFANTYNSDMTYLPPTWEEHLDLIHHLIKTDNTLITISGPQGVGKTTLMQQFSKQYDDSLTIRQTIAQSTWDEKKLIETLCIAFQLKKHITEDITEELESIVANIQYCKTTNVLIIDKAETLSMKVLKSILFMLDQQSSNQMRLHVILLGNDQLTKNLTTLTQEQFSDSLIRFIALQPFNLFDTTTYIQHRLTKAGAMDDMLFTTADIERIHKKSNGTPKIINTMCQQYLMKKLPSSNTTSLKNIQSNQSKLIGGLVIFGLIALAAIIINKYTNETTTNQRPTQTEYTHTNPIQSIHNPTLATLTKISANHVENHSVTETKQIFLNNKTTQPKEIQFSASELKRAEETLNQLITIKVPTQLQHNENNQNRYTSQPTAAQVAKAETVIQNLISIHASRVQINKTPHIMTTHHKIYHHSSAHDTINTDQQLRHLFRIDKINFTSPKLVSAKQIQFSIDKHNTTDAKKKERKHLAVIRLPITKNQDKPLHENHLYGEKQLLGLNKNDFTLQLLAVTNKKALQQFVKKYNLVNHSYYYQTKRNNNNLYILLYGQYPSFRAAMKAKDKLASQIQELKPWTRNIASVQYDIRQNV